MKVIATQAVEIALRTLGEEDRRRVDAWIDHLKNWEHDPHVRQQSRKLNPAESVYVLKTSGDYRLFFRLEADRIVLLDIAAKATILSFGPIAEVGRS